MSDLRFDPYDHELVVDPYPLFARIREEAPLYRNEEHDFWAVSRFTDVHDVLHDPDVFTNGKGNVLEIIRADIEMPSGVVIFEDPPVHSIHRKMLSRLFTPKRIMALEPQIRQFCVDVLDPLVGAGPFDIIKHVSGQVPMRAIGMLLGIPEEEQEFMRDAVDAAIRTESGSGIDTDQMLVSTDVFMRFVDLRIAEPGDDILSQLITAEFTDEHGVRRTLTRDEVCTYITVLGGAGNETTGRLIGWAAKYWAEHPDQRRELAANPQLIPNALEEILRLEPPAPFFARSVAQDIEVLGTLIPEGSVMMGIVGAANRDPRRYDDPDRYDIHRAGIQHLTFGGGIHYCMGNALARLEGKVVMEEFLTRFPDFDVDLTGASLAPTSTVRGWDQLTVVPHA